MPSPNELQRLISPFMDNIGDKYEDLETSSPSTWSLVGSKSSSVNQKTVKPAKTTKIASTITVSNKAGGDSRISLSSCLEKEKKSRQGWRKRLVLWLLRKRGSCSKFVTEIADVEWVLYKKVVTPDGKESNKRVFIVFSTMPKGGGDSRYCFPPEKLNLGSK